MGAGDGCPKRPPLAELPLALQPSPVVGADIVVITFMLAGTALCVTALVLAWRAVGKKLRQLAPDSTRRAAAVPAAN